MRTPRVNSTLLGQYQGKTVRLIGKVLKLEGETAIVEASDQGQVTIKLNRDSNFADQYVEIIGRVTGDTSISELTSYNIGDEIDMTMVDAVVRNSHKYPYLFHAETENNHNGY